jgi:hypothetical protein
MRKYILGILLLIMSNVFSQQPVIQVRKSIKIKSTINETLSYSVLGNDTSYHFTYKNCEYKYISDYRTITLTYNELTQLFDLCDKIHKDSVIITPKYTISKEFGTPRIVFGDYDYTYLYTVETFRRKLLEHKDPNNPIYKKGKKMPLVVIPVFVLLVVILI